MSHTLENLWPVNRNEQETTTGPSADVITKLVLPSRNWLIGVEQTMPVKQQPLWGYDSQIYITDAELPTGSSSIVLITHGFIAIVNTITTSLGTSLNFPDYAKCQTGKEATFPAAFLYSVTFYTGAIVFIEYIADISHTYIIFTLVGIIYSLTTRLTPTGSLLARGRN